MNEQTVLAYTVPAHAVVVLQQCPVVELRPAAIPSLDDANAFLPSFIERLNAAFAVLPEDPNPAFRPAPARVDLLLALALRDSRKASRQEGS